MPGESRGQRSLGGYGPWSHKKLDTNEAAKQGRGSVQQVFSEDIDIIFINLHEVVEDKYPASNNSSTSNYSVSMSLRVQSVEVKCFDINSG